MVIFNFYPRPEYVVTGTDRKHEREIMEQAYALDAEETTLEALQPIPEKLVVNWWDANGCAHKWEKWTDYPWYLICYKCTTSRVDEDE